MLALRLHEMLRQPGIWLWGAAIQKLENEGIVGNNVSLRYRQLVLRFSRTSSLSYNIIVAPALHLPRTIGGHIDLQYTKLYP